MGLPIALILVLGLQGVEGQDLVGTQVSDVDLNSDGTIEFTDFLLLVSVYNQPAETDENARRDFDRSGFVDFQDFLILAWFYGQTYDPVPPVGNDGIVGVFTAPPDTIAVGEVGVMSLSVVTSTVPETCDLTAIGGAVDPEEGGLSLAFGPRRTLPDSMIYSLELIAESPGVFSAMFSVNFCGEELRDTVSVTVRAP